MADPPTSTAENGSQLNANDKFFRYFQTQVTDLQSQFSAVEGLSGGERADAVDNCLAGIARLSNEVKDASSHLPAYDQRSYGDAIKALSQKLQDVRASFAPRQKFSFKRKPAFTAQKNESAISLSDTAVVAHGRPPDASSNNTSGVTTPESEPKDTTETVRTAEQSSSDRQPSHEQSKTLNLSDYDGMHLFLPNSASRTLASGTVSSISDCIVDMTSPLSQPTQPFATLTLKNIRDSLVVCGQVSGAAHLTRITNSVIVVASRQFRMHESRDCDVYLRTSSRPIIEDCTGISFAPLPEVYEGEGDGGEGEDLWQQVDDFKWLKSEPSPNWRVMGAEERVEERVWREVVPGRPQLGLHAILTAVGLTKWA